MIPFDEPKDQGEIRKSDDVLQKVNERQLFHSLYSSVKRKRFLFSETEESGYPSSAGLHQEDGRNEYRNSYFDIREGNREEQMILREISLRLGEMKELLGEDWRLDIE